nr:MAG TPA_asm: hypothetical protein [Bacteriophage sp.]
MFIYFLQIEVFFIPSISILYYTSEILNIFFKK